MTISDSSLSLLEKCYTDESYVAALSVNVIASDVIDLCGEIRALKERLSEAVALLAIAQQKDT